MNIKTIWAGVFALGLLSAAAPVSAADGGMGEQVTGLALVKLLHTKNHVVDGDSYSYGLWGAQFKNGERTGSRSWTVGDMWCNYIMGKKQYCVAIYHNGGDTYSAVNEDGSVAGTFTAE